MPKHSHRRVFAAWAILALCLCAFAWPAAASPWSPTLNFETKFGTDRTIVSTHLLIPFAGDDQSLLFGDFRSVSTRNYSWETNLGLAYRWLRPDGESAFGTYAFYDRRHILPTDSVWQQVTLGAEYLTANTTTRLNLYMPQQHRYLVTSTVADSFLIRGNNLIYQEADLNVYETAMRGFDVGVTHRIQSLLPFNVDFSVTGFHFTAPDAPNLTGANFRLETIFEDILNISGSQLTIGIEAQNDSLRGTESFVGMGIRIPFGAGGDSSGDSELTGVSGRLMDPVVRDIDIVTTRTNPLHEVAHEGDALLSDTGTAIEGIWFIEEGASNQGAGTPDDPISVEGLLSSARFGPNQIIVAQGQNDINVGDQSLTLLPGQILMSGESAIDLVSERGRRLTFQLDGTPTTLTTDVDLPIVTVSGNNIIRDIRFRGGSHAIFGDDVFGDVTISNVDIADSTRTGIYLAGESRESINISVSDSRIENTRTGILTDFFGVGDVQINILRNRIAAFDHGVDAHASDLTSGSFTLNENEIHVSPDANSDWVSGATVLLFAEETSTIEAVGNVIQIASEEEEPLNNGNGAWLYTVGAESEIFFIENTIVTDESVYRGVSLDAFSADEGGMAAAWLINSVIESATDGVSVFARSNDQATVGVFESEIRAGNTGILADSIADVGSSFLFISENKLEAGKYGVEAYISGSEETAALISENHITLNASTATDTAHGVFASAYGIDSAALLVYNNHIDVEADDEFEGTVYGLSLGTFANSSQIDAIGNVVHGDENTVGIVALADGPFAVGSLSLDEWDGPVSSISISNSLISAGLGGIIAHAQSSGIALVSADSNAIETNGSNLLMASGAVGASVKLTRNLIEADSTDIITNSYGDTLVQVEGNLLQGDYAALTVSNANVGDTTIEIVDNTVLSFGDGIWVESANGGDASLDLSENWIDVLGDIGIGVEIASNGHIDLEATENEISSGGIGLGIGAVSREGIYHSVAENTIDAEAGIIIGAFSVGDVILSIVENDITAGKIGIAALAAMREGSGGREPAGDVVIRDNTVEAQVGIAAGVLTQGFSTLFVSGNDVTGGVGILAAAISTNSDSMVYLNHNTVDTDVLGILSLSVGSTSAWNDIYNNDVTGKIGILGAAISEGHSTLVIDSNTVVADTLGALGLSVGRLSAWNDINYNDVTGNIGILGAAINPEGEASLIAAGNVVNADTLGIAGLAVGGDEAEVSAIGNTISGSTVGMVAGAIALDGTARTYLTDNAIGAELLGMLGLSVGPDSASTEVINNNVSGKIGILGLAINPVGDASVSMTGNSVDADLLGIGGLTLAGGDASLILDANTVSANTLGLVGLALAAGDANVELNDNVVNAEMLGIAGLALGRNDATTYAAGNEISDSTVGMLAGAIALDGNATTELHENVIANSELALLGVALGKESAGALAYGNTLSSSTLGLGLLSLSAGDATTVVDSNNVQSNCYGIVAISLSLLGTAETTATGNTASGCMSLVAGAGSLLGDAKLTVESNDIDALDIGIAGVVLSGAGDATAIIRNNNVNSDLYGIGALGVTGGNLAMHFGNNTITAGDTGLDILGLSGGDAMIVVNENDVTADEVGIVALLLARNSALINISHNVVAGNAGVWASARSTGDSHLFFVSNQVLYGELPYYLNAQTVTELQNIVSPFGL